MQGTNLGVSLLLSDMAKEYEHRCFWIKRTIMVLALGFKKLLNIVIRQSEVSWCLAEAAGVKFQKVKVVTIFLLKYNTCLFLVACCGQVHQSYTPAYFILFLELELNKLRNWETKQT